MWTVPVTDYFCMDRSCSGQELKGKIKHPKDVEKRVGREGMREMRGRLNALTVVRDSCSIAHRSAQAGQRRDQQVRHHFFCDPAAR